VSRWLDLSSAGQRGPHATAAEDDGIRFAGLTVGVLDGRVKDTRHEIGVDRDALGCMPHGHRHCQYIVGDRTRAGVEEAQPSMHHTDLAEHQCVRGDALVSELSQEGRDLGVCVCGEQALPFFPVVRFKVQRKGVHHLRPQEVGHLLHGALGEDAELSLEVGDMGGEGSGIGLIRVCKSAHMYFLYPIFRTINP